MAACHVSENALYWSLKAYLNNEVTYRIVKKKTGTYNGEFIQIASELNTPATVSRLFWSERRSRLGYK